MVGREVAAASDAWNAAGIPHLEPLVMRYELTVKWNAIRVMLPLVAWPVLMIGASSTTIGRTLARPSRYLWPPNHLL